ncbi:MAG: hypothetical protein ABIO70_14830 [Pseudomonadota bacterium]
MRYPRCMEFFFARVGLLALLMGCHGQGGRLAEPPGRLAEHEEPAPLAVPEGLVFDRVAVDTVHGGLVLLAEDRFWRVSEEGEVAEVLADPVAGKPRCALPDGIVLAGREADPPPRALSAWTGAAWEPAWAVLDGRVPSRVHALPDGRWVACREGRMLLLDPTQQRVRTLAEPALRYCLLDVGADGRVWAVDASGDLRTSVDLRDWTTAALPADLEPTRLVAGEGRAWLGARRRLVEVDLAGEVVLHEDRNLTRAEQFFAGRDGSLLVVGAQEISRLAGDQLTPLVALEALGGRRVDYLIAMDLGAATWVHSPGGVYRVLDREVSRLGRAGLVGPVGVESTPRVEAVGEEVWALSPSGGLTRVAGDALVEEARLGPVAALRAGEGDLWIGGLGRLWRREAAGTWHAWAVTLPCPFCAAGVRVPWVHAVVHDGEGGALVGTDGGLLRLDPGSAHLEPLPLEVEFQPSVRALERVGDTLYAGATNGLWVVDLGAEALTARRRFDPYCTHGLDLDGRDLLLSSDQGAYRVGTFGVARLLLARRALCTPVAYGQCDISNAVAHGDGVAWLALGARVVAAPVGAPDPERCGDWRPPADGPGRSPITDLTLAPDGALWAANNAGLHRLDPATCTGRTWRWPAPPGI